MRVNGFERPFHPLQVLSWVVSGADVLTYSVVGLPLIEPAGALAIVAACYGASVVVLVVAAAKATGCDPTDPRVRRLQDTAELEGEESDDLPYCPICDVPVEVRSKHCRTCNKCVDVFDHHCMWLNNCVGRANYRSFFVTVVAVAAMTGILLGTCVYIILDYIMDEEAFEERARGVFPGAPRQLLLGIVGALTVVNLPLFVLDLQLVLLHAFLMSQQLTTYEYIMNKQEQMEGRDEGKSMKSQSTVSKANAARRRLKQKIRTLPRCMDWIVFSRCGQKRKKRQARDVRQISAMEDPSAEKLPPEPEEAPLPEAASEPEAQSHGTPEQPEAPEPEEEGRCEDPPPRAMAELLDSFFEEDDRDPARAPAGGAEDMLWHVEADVPSVPSSASLGGKSAGVLPQHRQRAKNCEEGDGSRHGCSAYSGIALMWRFILGLGRTSLPS